MLKWWLALGAVLALSNGTSAFAQTCGSAPPGEFSIFADSANSQIIQQNNVNGNSPGTYMELNACINYAPIGGQVKYYTGTITNIFLDGEGHYLGSNGQGLTDGLGNALPTGSAATISPHHFGAGVSIGYTLASANSVATQVLVQASIIDCASSDISSCTGLPKPHLWLFQTGAPPTQARQPGNAYDCGHPPRSEDSPRLSLNGDPDPDDGQFRVYAEGLLRVANNPDGATTEVALLACLRLIPDDADARRAFYQGTASAYFFNTSGVLLGSGTQLLGSGGQQLNVMQIPKPYIALNDARLIDPRAGIHDLGVGVAVPLQMNYANIDSHVLVSVALTKCADDLSSCSGPLQTYYRIVDACAPDLPDFDTSRCPDIRR